MSNPGDFEPDDLFLRSRSALLDALEALAEHRDCVVVIGAQAIYLHTQGAAVALAEATKDSDLAIDPRRLNDAPLIEDAMKRAGFQLDSVKNQPGAWLNSAGIPVDLMVPELFAGEGGKGTRGARVPPHDKRALRRARGLEAAVVDYQVMSVSSLARDDQRRFDVPVAGRVALLIAKLHKIGERAGDPNPSRLIDKDAHDIYRLLVDSDTADLASNFSWLLGYELTAETAEEAVGYLADLFAAGADASGSAMAGRAETGVGEPATVALQTSILAADLVSAIRGSHNVE